MNAMTPIIMFFKQHYLETVIPVTLWTSTSCDVDISAHAQHILTCNLIAFVYNCDKSVGFVICRWYVYISGHNKIKQFSFILFSVTFSGRYLPGVHALDMSNRDLNDLPANISSQTASLILSDNHLTLLRSNMFSTLTNLTIIRLDGNQISTIGHGAFNRNFLLQYLYLNVNVIETIQAKAFSSLVDLRELRLDNNKISTLEHGAFEGLFQLHKLFLNINELSVLRADTFQPLWRLINLYLSHNRMITIENGTFNGLVKLCCLILDHNKLDQMPDLAPLSSLKYINIILNPIRSISVGRIEQFRNMTTLHFGHSVIHPLPSLSHMWRLHALSLLDMMLRRLPHHVLNGVATLIYINLWRNKLTHFPEFGESKRALEVLRLGDNRISYIPNLLPYKRLRHLDLVLNYITVVPQGRVHHMAGWLGLVRNPIPCVRQLCWLLKGDLPLNVKLICPDGRAWQLLDKQYICEGWSNHTLTSFISCVSICENIIATLMTCWSAVS